MKTVIVAKNGRVTRIGLRDERLLPGAIEVDSIPPEPEVYPSGFPKEAYTLYYTDGALEWRGTPLEDTPPPEPEPEPEPEPIDPAELRRKAYVAEAAAERLRTKDSPSLCV